MTACIYNHRPGEAETGGSWGLLVNARPVSLRFKNKMEGI